MLPIETVTAFFLASALLAIAPGPDNLFVLTQSALHGRLSGLVVVLGLCTGLIVHTTAVAFGVAVIFQTSALAFSLLKVGGALYLVYLAWQAFHASPETIEAENNGRRPFGALYRRGIIMNVTNPKVSIFFLAFLPQFVVPARGPVSLQMIILGGIFIFATILVFGTVAILGGTLGEWLNRSKKAQGLMNKMAGAVFLGLALKLASAQK